MKKLLSLALVMMLVLTSVFSGFSVFAEEAAADVIAETSWEEDYGIKVDESIYPGFYLGNSYQIWDTENLNYTTARTTEDGIKFMRVDPNTGAEYTYRDTTNHRKYAPSVAVNAGRTGGTGDNALVFGMPVSYSNGYILFRNRTKAGAIVCGTSSTWDISFDIKLVAGEVSKVYSNFRVNAPSLDHYADCEEDKSTSVNISGTTEGYSGTEISADKWTNLKFTATIIGQNNFFFINIQAPSENGAIVLIDNIRICDENGTNYLTSTNFAPVYYTTDADGVRVSTSPYVDEYEAGTLYISEEFGNFNSSTFVNKTLWHEYGYAVDESIVPGYYLGTDYDHWANASEDAAVNGSGIHAYNRGGYWYKEKTFRYNYAPSVAIGAGKSGRADDNALIFGIPDTNVAEYSLNFYMRKNGGAHLKSGKYQISFDIKSVAGSCAAIYANLTNSAPYHATCSSNANAISYNDKYDAETATYGTDGYNQSNIYTDKWTTLTYYVDLNETANYFWIKLVPAEDNYAIVLIDNIVIQRADGENLFVSENMMIAAKTNTLAYDTENDKQKYNLIQYHCGTFDYADAKAVDNAVDENVTYIPVSAIGQYSASVAPTLSEAGEGVNGSYAINVPVNENGVNVVSFRAYNPVASDTIHNNDIYMFEFKARVTAGTVDKLNVGIATNDWADKTAFKHNMQVFHNGTGTTEDGSTTYKHVGYTQTYLKVDGEELSNEWQYFRFYATTNCYDNVYRALKFTLYGGDSSVVIQLDDIKGYTVADGELTPIYVWGASDPNGSSFDLAAVSAYDVLDLGDGEYVVTVPEAGVTAADFIANMNLNAELRYGYANNKEMYSDDNLMAETDIIGTGDMLNLIGTTNSASCAYPTGSLYQAFTVVVANDVNGDAAVDLRDVVRAKKLSVGAEETTALHLIALNAVENEDGITATDVATLRDIFMQ